jgi:hypothetical protein
VTTAVRLSATDVVPERPFTAVEQTDGDVQVMQTMLERERELVDTWRNMAPPGAGALVREPDRNGLRHWIRVPDREQLLAPSHLTFVGFFGRARPGIDHALIHDLEAAIVDTLDDVPGVLSYYDLALPAGGYGNLILCDSQTAAERMQTHPLHQRAVALAPRHYHSVRLHFGELPGGITGTARLVPRRTRYFDYDCDPAWLAVRELSGATA